MTFNGLDVLVAVIILYSIVQGIVRGVTRQIISIGTLVVGLLLAAWYYPRLAPVFVTYFRKWELAAFLAFILIFVAVKLVGAAIGYLLGKALSAAELKWFDRILGGFFGLATGFLLSSVLFVALLAFPFELKWVKTAATGPFLVRGARFIAAITPPEIKVRFEDGMNRVRTIWEQSGST